MKKYNKYLPCRTARILLHIEMPLILLNSVIFLLSFLCDRAKNAAFALHHYPPLVQYLFFPIVITLFSVLLIERLDQPF